MKVCTAFVLTIAALQRWAFAAGSKELSITTIKQEPYTMTKGSEGELEGFCIDLISELSQKLGFTYKLHLVKDNRYGVMDASGNWNGMIGEVIRGDADLAVAPLTLTAIREQYVDMTTPFMQTGIGFILHKGVANDDDTFSLLAPFSTQMWVGVLLAFLLTGVCVFLMGRISPTEWAKPETDEHTFTLFHSYWYIIGALTLQGAGPHPKAVGGKVVSAIWWIFVVVVLACYFANLNSSTHDTNKHMSIKTFEDLADQDLIEYGTVDSGSTMLFFKNSNNAVYRRIYQHMERKKSKVANMEEGIRRAQEGNFAFIGEAASLRLAVARDCNLRHSREVVAMRAYSIAARQGSPMVRNLSMAVLQLSESGELTFLQDKWWASSCAGDDGAPDSDSLHPHDLRGLFLLLGLGLGVGLLFALLELLFEARRQATDEKKSCCSVLTSELNQRFGGGGEVTEQDTTDKSKA
ncbi:glutamate receptor U1 [Nerophis lumbriciformis]|uniref:glutamate receptor U1 n=1 Tax=Nerophis lumbriciformis TaxID=546530 RepID=UPI002AE08DFA|nr:glutamate receptor U1-like [Nerophis lumbriciformis]XP_061843958.1 glutamate receptor U1-like [Nerophis lumbriciformis]